ncbi:MAG: helix-turn-helix domain-containing protein [Hyphomicrobiaceae bacterium]
MKASKKETATAHKVAMARRLRQARNALGISQEKLAERLGGGLYKQLVSSYEDGSSKPPQLFLKRLERGTGITASWVITGSRVGLPGDILDKLPPPEDED